MSKYKIEPATKSATKLRLALFGPSGSGKTMSALRIATGIGGRIGVIDTERGSASKYSDRYPFDVINLRSAAVPDYLEAINAFSEAGHEILIIDSLTHAWEWLLDHVDKLGATQFRGNKWGAWSVGTPLQQQLVDAMLTYPGHVIGTMRARTEWVITTNDKGKATPERIGTSPKQRDSLEYEFDLLMLMNSDNSGHVLKDRTGKYQDAVLQPTEEFGAALAEWLADGGPEEEPISVTLDASRQAAQQATAPTPTTLSHAKAANLEKLITEAGHGNPLAFAAAHAGRTIRRLTDLNTGEALKIYRALETPAPEPAKGPQPEPEAAPPEPEAAPPEPEAAAPEEETPEEETPEEEEPPRPSDDFPPFDAATAADPAPAEEAAARPDAPAPFTLLTELGAKLRALGLDQANALGLMRWRTGRHLAALMELTQAEAEAMVSMSEDDLALLVDEHRTLKQQGALPRIPAA